MIILSEGKFLSKVGKKLGKIGNKIVDKVDDYSTSLLQPVGMLGSTVGGIMSLVPSLRGAAAGIMTGGGVLAGLGPMLKSMRTGAREAAIRKELRKREELAKNSDPKALEREAVRDIAKQSVAEESPAAKRNAKLSELRAKQGDLETASKSKVELKPTPSVKPVVPEKPKAVVPNTAVVTNTSSTPAVSTTPAPKSGVEKSGDAVGTMISNTPSPVVPQKDIVAKPLQKKKVTPGPVTTTT